MGSHQRPGQDFAWMGLRKVDTAVETGGHLGICRILFVVQGVHHLLRMGLFKAQAARLVAVALATMLQIGDGAVNEPQEQRLESGHCRGDGQCVEWRWN